MGKKTPAPPPAVDYSAAAQAQGAANLKSGLQTATINNPNIVNPYGTQTVTWDMTNPDMPTPTITQKLTPEAQKTLEAQQQVDLALSNLGLLGAGTARDILSKPFQSTVSQLQTKAQPVDVGDKAQGINAADYGRALQNLDLSNVARMPVNAGMTAQQAILSRLEPTLARQDAALEQRLANQGLTPGSQAYEVAKTLQGQQANDLRTQAALQGINVDIGANQQGFNQALQTGGFYNAGLGQNFGQGLAAQQLANAAIGQNFGQRMSAEQLAIARMQAENAAAQQQYQLELAQREQPLNEINALMSGSQIQNPQFQQYSGGGQIGAAPVFGAAQATGQQAMDLYGQQMAARNANMAALGNLAGTATSAFLMR
ncbi:MAG: hypothetical protein AMJ72_02755 [Acidithiobacillales bacterium SM1_46]|nr:MAG: hypothetical protein AMJ72_02755 [Acidithiobacillales bacterium SM1_46]